MSPAFPVVFVRNFFAVEVLCRYVFRTPLFTRTFLRVGTPSASKRFRVIDSADPSSNSVSCGDATLFPIFFPNGERDRKSTRLNSSHSQISYAVFCLKKKKKLRDVC